jgi:copper(I)-binding protein
MSTPVASKEELHVTRNKNGVVQMRALPALPREPGETLTLAPGGYHVMLLDLKRPPRVGDSFPLTLIFEKAKPITVQVKVGAVAPMSGMHGSPPKGGSKP